MTDELNIFDTLCTISIISMSIKHIKPFSIIFFLIVLAELIFDSSTNLSQLHYITKPAIVVSLLIFFWKQSQHLNNRLRLTTALALIFSVIGDILLMFVEHSPNYFMLGLVSFLIAHLMYAFVFLKHRNKNKNPIGFVGLLLIYAAGLFYLLKDGLGDMLIPVIVYMIIILSMATTAFLRKSEVNTSSYNFVFLGAVLFMMSDSLLALNKFYQSLAYSNITIMLTYALAQYFIVIGILKLSESPR
ncbi:lysoplasmalogenase [Ichthyenterobacterium magnum]|uniref:Putative membrane protein YhhN n=1 Tax=Ichthyenterobacterium magnum TaxID=1230530 RepID=A0A420DGM6_9FLAO|nr:lysoplasmalogenase [Ichthyenterobacterium magnum]RKE92230.1 putative membrane protein YhhN [Ichthyenterobacterium magnum]